MIQITKPTAIPLKLKKEGTKETQRLINLYEADEDYRKGIKHFEFKKSIYGHKSVKKALIKAQHQKCCFCERKTEIGDIEHYRSKGAYQQTSSGSLIKPGYYWLAYAWSNLFFCCEKCNRSYKRNYFPLSNPAHRAMSHLHDLSREQALIIHPEKEDCEQFIEFIGISPKTINGNIKGKETIKRVGLNRPFLNERRRDFYMAIKEIYLLSQDSTLPETKRVKLKKLVIEYAQPDKEYTSMIRCAIKHQFRF